MKKRKFTSYNIHYLKGKVSWIMGDFEISHTFFLRIPTFHNTCVAFVSKINV